MSALVRPIESLRVTRYFATHGVPTSTAATGAEMNRCLTTREPSLIILNRQVGRENGFDLLRSIRASSDVPVIIASSDRLEEIDCVLGLELGADDYIVKPFRLRELLARMRAILRRQRLGQLPKAREPALAGYVFGGWRLECCSRRLTTPDGQSQPLTKSEYTLLVAFLKAPQRPLTREQLLQATRVHEDTFDRSIDVRVLRLRRKLEGPVGGPRMILTERGVGYSFALPVESRE